MSATDVIGPWMLAATVLAALLGLGAWGAEWLMASLGRSRRHVWSVALTLSVVWPGVGWFAMTRSIDALAPAEIVASRDLADGPVLPLPVDAAESASWTALGTVLLALWAVLSLLVLVSRWRAYRALYQVQRDATPAQMHGVPVLRTRSLGPAVVGLQRPQLLMPQWVWQLDATLQRLVLQHELEHQRAGDAWLIGGGVLATTLLPWNPFVWWIMQRLRLALEVDCDARTLRAVPHGSAQYAPLLLLMSQHRQPAPLVPPLVPMLVPTASQLSRRIDAMLNPPSRSPLRRIFAALLIGTAGVAACSRHISNNLAGPATPELHDSAARSAEAADGSQVARTYFDYQTENPASLRADSRMPVYPAALRDQGVKGVVIAQFVVDADGRVDPATLRVVREAHTAFVDAVRETLPGMRFTPATINGQGVRQLVQMPFAFESATAGSTGTASGGAASSTSQSALDERAQLLPDSPGPTYPVAQRANGVEGTVIAQFVVDTTGTVLPGSLRVLRSTHDDFTAAVRDALPQMRYRPARVNGRAVRQLLEEPFAFRLDR